MLSARGVVLGMLAAVATGCGARPMTEAEVNAVFSRIQVEEARLAVAERRVRDPEGDCASRRAAADEARAASDSLCEAAATVDDRDAALRCERARRTRDELSHATRECATAPGGGP